MISLKYKLLIDKLLGKTLCFFIAPIIRLTGIVLKLDHSLSPHNIHNIVVAKYYGMGSIIHATGLLRELKKTYPDSKIIFLTRKSSMALLKHIRHIDGMLSLDDTSVFKLFFSVLNVLIQLWKLRVDLFLDLEVYSCFSALMSSFSLARNRIGFFAGRSSDYKSFLYNRLIYMNSNMPIRTCYLQLGKAAGIPLTASSDLDELEFSDLRAQENMKRILQEIAPKKTSKGMIAVNVNASELSFARRWDKRNFAEVCKIFSEKGYQVFLVGSPDEYQYVQEVKDLIPAEALVYNVAGKFPFTEFLLFLKNCRLLLTNDAGIMNMGFILRIPVLSLWGPGQPIQYHVDSTHTQYLKADIYCSPCLYVTEMSPCSYYKNPVCMALIKQEKVVELMEKMLNDPSPYVVSPNPYDNCPLQKEFPLGMMYNIYLSNNNIKEK